MDDRTYELPIIAPNDFDAFRRLPTRDLPDTYDEWFNLVSERRLEREYLGFKIIEVQVNANEFTRYLSRTGVGASLKTLADFCRESALGNDY